MYKGLPSNLKEEIYIRDNMRCRWCGVTNALQYDVHHIEYRRGKSYDVAENLILLCRTHHNYVHDSYLIQKTVAQDILKALVSTQGQTGVELFRARQTRGNKKLPRVGRLLSSGEEVDK